MKTETKLDFFAIILMAILTAIACIILTPIGGIMVLIMSLLVGLNSK